MELFSTLEQSAFSTWLRESSTIWAYPTVLTLHTLGLGVLVGANWALDFRLLGVGSEVPLGPLKGLFRAMWIGFIINAITGCMLFAADATSKGTTIVFMVKLALILAAVIVLVVIRRLVYRGGSEIGTITPAARMLAVLSLLLWAGAITAGRLMAYL